MENDFEEVETKPPSYSSPSVRRKVVRQQPVSKQPNRVRRAHTTASDGDTSRRKDDDEAGDCVYVRRRSTFRDATDILEERKNKYIAKRRKTMDARSKDSLTECNCRSHTGALSKCRCQMSRQTSTPNVSESELMKHETKLVVLEYLQHLSPLMLTAQLKKSPPSSPDLDKSCEMAGSSNEKYSSDSIFESSQRKQYKEEEMEYSPQTVAAQSASSTDTTSGIFEISFTDRLKEEPVERDGDMVRNIGALLSTIGDCIPDSAKANDERSSNHFWHEEDVMSTDRIKSDEEMSHPDDCFKKSEKQTGSVKYNTVTIGEYEHQKLLQMIKDKEKSDLEKTGGTKIGRSQSSISEEQFTAARNKLRDMQKPVEKWLDVHSKVQWKKLFSEVKRYDKTNLKTKANRSVKKRNWIEKKNKSLSLKIPQAAVPPAEFAPKDAEIFTPETITANKLELISQEIMKNSPELIHQFSKEMLFIVTKSDVSYDVFSKVAENIYSVRADNKKATVWSRVAMVLYAVRETFFLGNLNDKQMELLVEYSTKFFTENAAESVRNEGGWEAAIGGEIFAANGMTFDDDWEDENVCLTHGNDCLQPETDYEYSDSEKYDQPDGKTDEEKNLTPSTDTVTDWTPYGVAAISVGLGLLYSYSKS